MLARPCLREILRSRVVAYLPVRCHSAVVQSADQFWEETGHLSQPQPRTRTRTQSQFQSQPRPQSQYDARVIAASMKRNLQRDIARKRRKLESDGRFLPEGSNDEILEIEVKQLLDGRKEVVQRRIEDVLKRIEKGDVPPLIPSPSSSDLNSTALKSTDLKPPAELNHEVELEVMYLSSTGDGFAYNEAKDHIIVIPFSIPGDRVLAKVWKWEGRYSQADFIRLVRPSPRREGVIPGCKYFTQCSGCQLQMLPYEAQLEHKRQIVQKAFQNFSGLSSKQIPEVEPTMSSPLQYEYRTKLTPHFDGPKRVRRQPRTSLEKPPAIGFNTKARGKVLDIESCPIGTEILQEGLKIERAKVIENYASYKNGATILLRESTNREYKSESNGTSQSTPNANLESPLEVVTTQRASEITRSGKGLDSNPHSNVPSDPQSNLQSSTLTHSSTGAPSITAIYPTHKDIKSYTSDSLALTSEYITVTTDSTTTPPATRTYKFTNIAGSFFQNNNSILGPFTSYIYSLCIPPKATITTPSTAHTNNNSSDNGIKYLLDAYSGSGLFTITLSPLFVSSLGIDVNIHSIESARANALANALPASSCGFVDADAAALFADVPYPPAQTLCVLDPPRKGCDRAFLRQLRRFGPQRVIYVSCNVHTQARDVGVLVNGFRGGDAEEIEEHEMWRYEIESVRGCDFFPQTGHVEGVCVLNRVERGRR